MPGAWREGYGYYLPVTRTLSSGRWRVRVLLNDQSDVLCEFGSFGRYAPLTMAND